MMMMMTMTICRARICPCCNSVLTELEKSISIFFKVINAQFEWISFSWTGRSSGFSYKCPLSDCLRRTGRQVSLSLGTALENALIAKCLLLFPCSTKGTRSWDWVKDRRHRTGQWDVQLLRGHQNDGLRRKVCFNLTWPSLLTGP